ncbi:MAG: (deoxy)nucleoside triphosphate pyrophosphohydrolase [Hyphomonadaceae bacterium]
MPHPSPSTRPLLIVVAAAVLDKQGRVLIAQRPPGKAMAGLWEFPGGKVEPGETPEAALIRELEEELGLAVAAEALEPIVFASHAYADFHLLMPLYGVRAWDGAPRALEHAAIAWADADALAHYPMPPADAPLLASLSQWMRQP